MVIVCCFNPRPPITPPTTAAQPPRSPSARARPKYTREICWTRQCVVGMAMAIVMVGLDRPTPTIIGDEHKYDSTSTSTSSAVVKGRWSSKRRCQAWQLNSLETIVPEDLPRPSFKRTWEWVDAPPVKATSSDCFSM